MFLCDDIRTLEAHLSIMGLLEFISCFSLIEAVKGTKAI